MSKEQKLFAIWKYDSEPYWLGGIVKELCEEGYVRVEGYEPYRFKYHKLYPLKEGEALITKIQEEGVKYKNKKDKAHKEMLDNVKKLMGE